MVFVWLNLLVAVFTDAVFVHNLWSKSDAKQKEEFVSSSNNFSSSRLFEGVEERRISHLKPIIGSNLRLGRGYTFKAIANVLSEVDHAAASFEIKDRDSYAKKKWKLASRVVLERNRLIHQSDS
jgi:hypothetical protein